MSGNSVSAAVYKLYWREKDRWDSIVTFVAYAMNLALIGPSASAIIYIIDSPAYL